MEAGDAAEVDRFAYVDAVPLGELHGHIIFGDLVDRVDRTDDDRFDHCS